MFTASNLIYAGHNKPIIWMVSIKVLVVHKKKS